ncbi:MAG: signal peptidase I [Parabacteroides sp.]|nr:signal peptidase I [Parabacteroides sp.]
MKNTPKIRRITDYFFYAIYAISSFILLFIVLQIFFLSTFRIPSDSMYPTLEAGDNVWVCKPMIGARIFNIFASLRNEQTTIYRLPGLKRIQRNDILVFNFPCPSDWNSIEMHILKYYVKRCVGLPGDSLSIENGYFKIKGYTGALGNPRSQKEIAKRTKDKFGDGVYHSFPYDTLFNWNIKDFGPLYIPKAGDSILINQTNYILYKKYIEWEQQCDLNDLNGHIYLGNKVLTHYKFKKNYYFMAGDNGMDSQDSRYWGLLPEEYIVGKAWLVWKSVDPQSHALKWNRLFKAVN